MMVLTIYDLWIAEL